RTFGCSEALVAAETARVCGRPHEATRLYEESIKAARAGGFLHVEALAFELASRCYRAQGFDAVADLYLGEARDAYARWGAAGAGRGPAGKAQQPEALRPAAALPPADAFESLTTLRAGSAELDLFSVLSASQAISREVVLGKLLEQLLSVVLAHGGAERGCLLLARRGVPFVEAEAASRGDAGIEVRTFRDMAAASSTLIPRSIVNYAWR